MSTSSDTRLHFEGVLDKAGKRFFEVSLCNAYLVRLRNLNYGSVDWKGETNNWEINDDSVCDYKIKKQWFKAWIIQREIIVIMEN